MIEIVFPKQYKKLPKGYKVVWIINCEKYQWQNDKEEEGLIYCDRYVCRRSAFRHYEKSKHG